MGRVNGGRGGRVGETWRPVQPFLEEGNILSPWSKCGTSSSDGRGKPFPKELGRPLLSWLEIYNKRKENSS